MGAKHPGAKRPGAKRPGGETSRGGNGLGAKRPGTSVYTRVISWCLTSGEVQHAIRLVYIKKSIRGRGPVWEGS